MGGAPRAGPSCHEALGSFHQCDSSQATLRESVLTLSVESTQVPTLGGSGVAVGHLTQLPPTEPVPLPGPAPTHLAGCGQQG